MSIVKWNPWREMEALQRDMDRLFSRGNSLFDGDEARVQNGNSSARQSWMLATDVVETQDALTLKAALPGIDPKDIDVQVEDNVLTIRGERHFERVEEGHYHWTEQRYGSFSRSVTLPPYADVTRIAARYNNGVLELTIPKREESKPRKIELKLDESATQSKAIGDGQSGGRTVQAGSETTVNS